MSADLWPTLVRLFMAMHFLGPVDRFLSPIVELYMGSWDLLAGFQRRWVEDHGGSFTVKRTGQFARERETNREISFDLRTKTVMPTQGTHVLEMSSYDKYFYKKSDVSPFLELIYQPGL